MTCGTRQTDSKDQKNRRDYRVQADLEIRIRAIDVSEGDPVGPDPVALFEELSLASGRFRKELGPSGRSFVDKLMVCVDVLTGLATENESSTGWVGPIRGAADLSAGGLGIVSDTGFDIGSVVELEFSVVDASSTVPFRCRAEVMRSNTSGEGKYDLGFSFTELSSPTQRRLVRTVLELQRVELRNQGGTG